MENPKIMAKEIEAMWDLFVTVGDELTEVEEGDGGEVGDGGGDFIFISDLAIWCWTSDDGAEDEDLR